MTWAPSITWPAPRETPPWSPRPAPGHRWRVSRAFNRQALRRDVRRRPRTHGTGSWGSNSRSLSTARTLDAAHFNATGTHVGVGGGGRSDAVPPLHPRAHPLNMVYMTNMAGTAASTRRSSSITAGSRTPATMGTRNTSTMASRAGWSSRCTLLRGRHADFDLWPSPRADSRRSQSGVRRHLRGGQDPGGYAYRDFSVACVYTNNMCTGASWEITEPMAAYEGPFILLVSFEM